MTALETLPTFEYRDWKGSVYQDGRGFGYVLYAPDSPEEPQATRLRYATAQDALDRAHKRIDGEPSAYDVFDNPRSETNIDLPAFDTLPIRVPSRKVYRKKRADGHLKESKAAVVLCSCGGDTSVLETRHEPDATRRRRQCAVCKKRYNTYEVHEDVFLAVQRKDNKLHQFAEFMRELMKEGE